MRETTHIRVGVDTLERLKKVSVAADKTIAACVHDLAFNSSLPPTLQESMEILRASMLKQLDAQKKQLDDINELLGELHEIVHERWMQQEHSIAKLMYMDKAMAGILEMITGQKGLADQLDALTDKGAGDFLEKLQKEFNNEA